MPITGFRRLERGNGTVYDRRGDGSFFVCTCIKQQNEGKRKMKGGGEVVINCLWGGKKRPVR